MPFKHLIGRLPLGGWRRLNRGVLLHRAVLLVWSIFRAVLVIGISFVIVYPLFEKLSMMFKPQEDIYNLNVIWIPQHPTLQNIKDVMTVMQYGSTVFHTFLLSGLTMLLLTVTCALAGYAFARLKFPGSGLLFACVIFTIVVPPQTVMLPNYLNFKSFDPLGLATLVSGGGWNLIGTYWPFALSSVLGMGLKAGLYVFIFRQFFRGMPKELEEAALVDGAGMFGIFARIMMPNAIPATITVMLFAFVWQWNDIFYTSMYMSGADVMSVKLSTLPVYMQKYAFPEELSAAQLDPFYMSILMNTGLLLAVLPLIVLYALVQKYFVESVERTGVVG
ncbi:MAG: carbohydrate ABC transporter permease [Paenibacillaceae bacterium]|nr:carbohydrate ABC transporter permease [Paenibacillaceae bacterium]